MAEKQDFFNVGVHQKSKNPVEQEVFSEIRDMTRRIRLLEERSINTRKNLQVIEHNVIRNNSRVNRELSILHDDIDEIRKEMNEIKQELRMIESELRESAKKEDLAVLQHYVEMWQPVNFVTHNELNNVVARAVKDAVVDLLGRKKTKK